MLLSEIIPFNSFLWFCAGGTAFFSGVALLIVTSITLYFQNTRWIRILMRFLQAGAGLMIFLSAAALPLWGYVIGFFLFIICQVNFRKPQIKKATLGVFIIFAVTAIITELPRYSSQTITVNHRYPLVVVGDSISAGMGNRQEKTWSKQLSETTGLQVINLAQAGATVSTLIQKQLPQVPSQTGLVIIEIGGNDLLNHHPVEAFGHDCELMLQQLQAAGHTFVWLELPVLAHYYPYGRVQRKLARQYNVPLIPRSVMTQVFSSPRATSDGMHLTEKGHEILAHKINQFIEIN